MQYICTETQWMKFQFYCKKGALNLQILSWVVSCIHNYALVQPALKACSWKQSSNCVQLAVTVGGDEMKKITLRNFLYIIGEG